MKSTTYFQVREAIESKSQLIATYDGHIREMCPHVIGLNKRGEEQVLVYQFAGGSSRGEITSDSSSNWRCIKISGLENVSLRAGKWHTFDNHSKEQTCVSDIDLEVVI